MGAPMAYASQDSMQPPQPPVSELQGWTDRPAVGLLSPTAGTPSLPTIRPREAGSPQAVGEETGAGPIGQCEVGRGAGACPSL